ncbi:cop9 signalosome complex subunit 4, partial [Nannochloropsis gaditana]
MVAVHAAVAEIQSMASQADRTSRQKCKYTELLTELMDSFIPPSSSSAPTTSLVSFVSEMKALVDHLLSPQVSTLVSRSVFAHLGQSLLERLPRQGKYACSEEQLQALQDVAEYALEQGGSHTQAFEEADASVREFLFEHLKAQGCYRSAASVLAGMNMDASTRPLSEDAKADTYVKIAETFLVEDQAVEAEAFVNRASGLMEAVTDYWVQLRYRVTYAKVLDANRKFLEAALRYHELSQTQRREVPEEELLLLLGRAVTCAILGKAGPQ